MYLLRMPQSSMLRRILEDDGFAVGMVTAKLEKAALSGE